MMQEGEQANIGDRPLETRIGWISKNMSVSEREGVSQVGGKDVANGTQVEFPPMLFWSKDDADGLALESRNVV